MRKDQPMDRRRFFREGLRELLRPLANAAQPLEDAVRQLAAAPAAAPAHPRNVSEKWLRPPGALAEKDFLSTCSRCAKCVEVCPAQCIKIDPTGAKGNGAPYINPDAMPCVVCDSLACMNHCPTGALLPTPLVLIDMGTARWNPDTCVRTSGEDCTICVDHCPVGEMALRVNGRRIEVFEDGCIGCGVCQHDCPTSPKSIVVQPRA